MTQSELRASAILTGRAFVSLPANAAPAWVKSLVRIVLAKSEEAIGSPSVCFVAGSPGSLSCTT
jgi:hypothetical protein